MNRLEIRDVVATYGATTKAKFSNVAVTGAPEEQIRAPMEELVKSLAAVAGYGSVVISASSDVPTPTWFNYRPESAQKIHYVGRL